MKDGIYRVTLTIDGQPIVAEAQIRNGVFQGLGELAGLVGVFSTPAQDGAEPGELGMREAAATKPAQVTPLAIDASALDQEARLGALANDLRVVRDEVDAIQRKAQRISPVDVAGRSGPPLAFRKWLGWSR